MINAVVLQKALLPKSADEFAKAKQNQYLECNVVPEGASALVGADRMKGLKADMDSQSSSRPKSVSKTMIAPVRRIEGQPPATNCRYHHLYLATSLSNYKTKHIPKSIQEKVRQMEEMTR